MNCGLRMLRQVRQKLRNVKLSTHMRQPIGNVYVIANQCKESNKNPFVPPPAQGLTMCTDAPVLLLSDFLDALERFLLQDSFKPILLNVRLLGGCQGKQQRSYSVSSSYSVREKCLHHVDPHKSRSEKVGMMEFYFFANTNPKYLMFSFLSLYPYIHFF